MEKHRDEPNSASAPHINPNVALVSTGLLLPDDLRSTVLPTCYTCSLDRRGAASVYARTRHVFPWCQRVTYHAAVTMAQRPLLVS